MTSSGSSWGSPNGGVHSANSTRGLSQVVMDLQHNHADAPGPGEMVKERSANSYREAGPYYTAHPPQSITHSHPLGDRDPYHSRAPGRGELHSELEAGREAQVVCYGSEPLADTRF